MLVFFIGAVFGVAQLLLLKFLLNGLAQRRSGRAFLLFLLKFALYGIAIALLMFRYSQFTENAIYGLVTAFPLAAVLMFVYSIFSKQIKDLLCAVISKIKKPRV